MEPYLYDGDTHLQPSHYVKTKLHTHTCSYVHSYKHMHYKCTHVHMCTHIPYMLICTYVHTHTHSLTHLASSFSFSLWNQFLMHWLVQRQSRRSLPNVSCAGTEPRATWLQIGPSNHAYHAWMWPKFLRYETLPVSQWNSSVISVAL